MSIGSLLFLFRQKDIEEFLDIGIPTLIQETDQEANTLGQLNRLVYKNGFSEMNMIEEQFWTNKKLVILISQITSEGVL